MRVSFVDLVSEAVKGSGDRSIEDSLRTMYYKAVVVSQMVATLLCSFRRNESLLWKDAELKKVCFLIVQVSPR